MLASRPVQHWPQGRSQTPSAEHRAKRGVAGPDWAPYIVVDISAGIRAPGEAPVNAGQLAHPHSGRTNNVAARAGAPSPNGAPTRREAPPPQQCRLRHRHKHESFSGPHTIEKRPPKAKARRVAYLQRRPSREHKYIKCARAPLRTSAANPNARSADNATNGHESIAIQGHRWRRGRV